jgi:hypothetical protein
VNAPFTAARYHRIVMALIIKALIVMVRRRAGKADPQ